MKGIVENWKKWAVISLIVIAISGFGYWGIQALSSGGKSKLVMITKPITRGELEVKVIGWGNLEPSDQRNARSGATGVIQELFIEWGQQVSEGQVLAIVDAGSLEIEIKKIEIELEQKRVKLAQDFGVSPDEVADVDPTAALTVRSPISGRIDGLTVKPGNSPEGIICKVVDDSTLKIQLLLPKPLFDKVEVGQKVSFKPERFDGLNDGIITYADPTPIAGEATYYYDVWIEVKNPGLLKTGDKGTVTVHSPLGEFHQKAEITEYGNEHLVSSSFVGTVKRIFLKDGASVQAGEPILEFEPGIALLKAMEGQLEFKEMMLKLEESRLQLGSLEIISPIDGVIMEISTSVGSDISKGSSIGKVSNFDEMNLMLHVDEIDLPKIEKGQMVDVDVWGPQGQQKVQGVVSNVGISGDMRDGLSSFGVTVSITNPGFLQPYMHATANIFVSKKDDVLLCPVEALYKEDEKWFADLKDGNSRKPIQVEVGAMNEIHAEIVSGLEEGDEVVVAMSKDPDQNDGGMHPIPYF